MHASRRVTDEKGLRGLQTMRVQVAQRDVGHQRDISNRVLRRRASHMTRTYPSNDTIHAHHSLTSMSHCTTTVKESAHRYMYVCLPHASKTTYDTRERERECDTLTSRACQQEATLSHIHVHPQKPHTHIYARTGNARVLLLDLTVRGGVRVPLLAAAAWIRRPCSMMWIRLVVVDTVHHIASQHDDDDVHER